MPRARRMDVGEVIYHVLNRANARVQLFESPKDYLLFEKTLAGAKRKVAVRILAYCIMPNHFHLVLCTTNDGDLSKFMTYLTLTHAQRWHASRGTVGNGHVYQGRYKSFPIQSDEYFLEACRYVECNAVSARLVARAEYWRWGSAWWRWQDVAVSQTILDEWPLPAPSTYLDWLNEKQEGEKFEKMQVCIKRQRPYGTDAWVKEAIDAHRLGTTLRKRGRPKKGS